MTLYFDSAYIAKCYLNEPDGAQVREIARQATGLHSSSLCIAEIACVFHRQAREGSISTKQLASLRKNFADDVKDEVWGLLPITWSILQRVDSLIRGLKASAFIRAGDAIHLASAIEHGFDEIWTNDRHLLAAASAAGLAGRSIG